MRKFFTRIGLAVGSLFALGLLFAAPSFAATSAQPPANTNMPVSVTVISTLTISIDTPTAFEFAGMALPGSDVGQLGVNATNGEANVTVATSDPAGYTLTALQSGPLTSGANTIPIGSETLSAWWPFAVQDNHGAPDAEQFVLSAAPDAIGFGTGATAGDVYPVALQVAIPAAQAPGAYATQTIAFTATAS